MLKALALAGLFAVFAPALRADVALVSAIAEVETGGNPAAIGRRGERGMHQFRAATWAEVTYLPFSRAHDPRTSTEVALKHIARIRRLLTAAGKDATDYNIACAWNAGVFAVVWDQVPARSRDYAQRVVNIATDNRRQ